MAAKGNRIHYIQVCAVSSVSHDVSAATWPLEPGRWNVAAGTWPCGKNVSASLSQSFLNTKNEPQFRMLRKFEVPYDIAGFRVSQR